MNRRWRTVFGLEWRWLDGEAVAYFDVSGDTFKLEPLAAEVLQRLAEAPATTRVLVEAMAPPGALFGLRDQIEAIIDRFREVGVVEAVEP